MTKTSEHQPEAVLARATRAGEPPNARTLRVNQPLTYWKLRAEPTIWTERMLTALLEGVKGGTWYSLIDKIHPERTLSAAFAQVAANQGAAGVDHVTVTMFAEHLDQNLKALSAALRDDTYRPQQIRRHYIPKPGVRSGARWAS